MYSLLFLSVLLLLACSLIFAFSSSLNSQVSFILADLLYSQVSFILADLLSHYSLVITFQLPFFLPFRSYSITVFLAGLLSFDLVVFLFSWSSLYLACILSFCWSSSTWAIILYGSWFWLILACLFHYLVFYPKN